MSTDIDIRAVSSRTKQYATNPETLGDETVGDDRFCFVRPSLGSGMVDVVAVASVRHGDMTRTHTHAAVI